MFAKLLLAGIALQALLVSADPQPTNPAPGDKCVEGQQCLAGWVADQSDTWEKMQIVLMTGSNTAMVELGVLATVDGSSDETYKFKTPQVYPHSEIYFLEFRSPDSDQKYWTGRFLITATDGVSSPPTNSTTESNGEKILWGTGMLINATNPLPASSNTSSSLPVGSGTLSSTPASTQTGVNSGTSQDGSNGDMTVALSKVLVFAVGVVTVSTAFFL